jgi:hypothetical protein
LCRFKLCALPLSDAVPNDVQLEASKRIRGISQAK